MPSAMSAGATLRFSGVAAHCAAKCSGLWRTLGSVGPGPMPFTRIRGPSASAAVCVSVQSPALLSV